MKDFEYFLKKGIVKKTSKNKARAKSLVEESNRKFGQFEKYLKKMGVNEENANDIVEDCHDVLLGLIRAKILLSGFNASGFRAHEAEISFLSNLNFTEQEIDLIQKLRYFRNGIMYYGKKFDKESAKKIIIFTKKIFQKLKKILNLS